MDAEIIGVGTELLLGQTINSDSAYVASELASMGINVFHTQVVGDNSERLEQVLREALGRSDIVITTGGLGPTKDDLTKETAAIVANAPLIEDAGCLAMLKEYFGTRAMSDNQRKQALVPQGATIFPNTEGTAPGLAIPCGDGKFIILLPGPPREVIPMLKNQIRPFLQNLVGGAIFSTAIRVFGCGEGSAAQTLDDLLNGSNPTAATYASEGEFFVSVSAKGENMDAAKGKAAPLIKQIRARLGDYVYGVDVPGLEYVVVNELVKNKMTVACAESCTGGMLAGRITDVPGASAVFGLGVVTYANEAKMRMLNIPEKMLAEHGAVSEPVAKAMAQNIRAIAGSDFGIGITGVAGPDGGTPEKPVGLVYICLAAEDEVWLKTMRPQGRYLGRKVTRTQVVNVALDLLRRKLAAMDMPESTERLTN